MGHRKVEQETRQHMFIASWRQWATVDRGGLRALLTVLPLCFLGD
jgi:hypothetical protein